MKTLIASILTLCLCACAACAWAQEGSDPPEEASGLDIFYPGMSRADAQEKGAVAAGESQMKAKVDWDGTSWNVVLILKDDNVAIVSLATKLTSNAMVYGMLQAMEERLAVPLTITRKVKGEKKQQQLYEMKSKGKSDDELNEVMVQALGDYADQDGGSISILYCPLDMRTRMAELFKAGNEDENALAKEYGDSMIYTMRISQSNDVITVMVASLETLSVLGQE